jgi:hypothetical protein
VPPLKPWKFRKTLKNNKFKFLIIELWNINTNTTQGKQLCCTLEEKINKKPDNHSDDDGHDHNHSNKKNQRFKCFYQQS